MNATMTIYQLDALKDDYEELEENYRVLQKEYKSRVRQHELLLRDHASLVENSESEKILSDAKIKKFEEDLKEKHTIIQQQTEELEWHKKLLEESKAKPESTQTSSLEDTISIRETNKQTRYYQYKWDEAKNENSNLLNQKTRLENQVARLKESLKEAEATENELKVKKLELQRELRESKSRVEELETNKRQLQRRIDRMLSRNLLLDTSTDQTSGTTTKSTYDNDNQQ